MFVDPTHGRLKGYATYALGAAVGVFALGACNDPEQLSDLRPAGPPEVLTVLVMNDAASNYVETATFCKVGDDKRPTEVYLIDGTLTTVCPLEPGTGVPMVDDALPTGWYVRVVFDELLDPDIEELIANIDPSTNMPSGTFTGTIANTHPVTLTCDGVEVPYDGYYSPSGNYQTWPVGPSLVIIPEDPTSVPTGVECTVSINENVVDKQGEPVPMDQRGMGGQYKFKVATLTLTSTDPASIVADDAADRSVSPPEAPVSLFFNALIDPASITSAEVRIFKGVAADCTGGTQVPMASIRVFQLLDDAPPDGVPADEMSIQIADGSAANANITPEDPTATGLLFDENETYRIEFAPNADVEDLASGIGLLELPLSDDGDPSILCFDTDAAS